MEIRDKKVTVVGMARSGIGAANLLAGMGASVTVTDMKTARELAAEAGRLIPAVRTVCGEHPADLFEAADLVVVSPGVPLDIAPLRRAKSRDIRVIGELELAYEVIRNSGARIMEDEAVAVPFLAVTGSNGKSTTTTLLASMMQCGGFRTVLGGNIGNALTEEIITLRQNASNRVDCFVVEVSSFQLEAIDRFRPRVASVLNITPDHLDRYHSMEEYRDAKARIFLNQGPEDFLVLNADDPLTAGLAELSSRSPAERPCAVYFSRSREVEGIFLKDGMLFWSPPSRAGQAPKGGIMRADEIRIQGVHNLENAMAASAMALLADCPPEAVIETLREFEGLEHRLEFVRELDGVLYINDSKGTNVGAVMKSIESFGQPLILIAGGRDKAGDFAALRDLAAARVKALVLIGEAAGKIHDALRDVTRTVMARDLHEAVAISRSLAEKGDAVLLSPACASFDMFRDFEDRGRQFKEIVRGLRGNA